jgi:hypothetical protein
VFPPIAYIDTDTSVEEPDEGMMLMMDQLHLSNPGKSFIYKCFCFLGHNSTAD